ncbi:accessory factor UbiK family protein [Roseospira marina]|uniref:Accessory factor UbiK family protein n=1 Tax=Roseospira marina TaxID=140057 RepID=A0A5M6IHF0_9PROT|nr:accessory factor UbiK family protein [Roseospira marina]KAA5607654.1 accessory factor UbiK family protein [Roseospira marina]MBB4312145.1 hypothetical protein [Roseospira marina]MBB5085839.1 hypothetical protein [Roseospira marina]
MSGGGPKVFDDLSRLAGGALGALGGLRSEIEEMVRQRVERMANELDLVTREDFEIAREMAAEARAENEELVARVTALEEQVAQVSKSGSSAKSGGAKSARRKAAGSDDDTDTAD